MSKMHLPRQAYVIYRFACTPTKVPTSISAGTDGIP